MSIQNYKNINPSDLLAYPHQCFDKDWALLSAGDEKNANSMVISWGASGTLWGKTVVFAFVRPQRYTYEFMEKNDYFSISFYKPEDHAAIAPFGSKSGRDVDKYELTKIHPIPYGKTVFTEGARLVFICKKIAFQDLDPSGFLDSKIDSDCYPSKDYHRMYIGEIEEILQIEK